MGKLVINVRYNLQLSALVDSPAANDDLAKELAASADAAVAEHQHPSQHSRDLEALTIQRVLETQCRQHHHELEEGRPPARQLGPTASTRTGIVSACPRLTNCPITYK